MKAVMVAPASPTSSFNGANNATYLVAYVGQATSFGAHPDSDGGTQSV